MAVAEELSTNEAAVVARITPRDVARAIDEKILPAGFATAGERRTVAPEACALLAFYFDDENELQSAARVRVIREFAERLPREQGRWGRAKKADMVLKHRFVTIDMSSFVERADEGLARLERARSIVSSSSDTLGGTPLIKDTRIPVYDVAASLRAGISVDRIINAYPALSAEAIELCRIYAEAYPPRGRPKLKLPPDAKLLSERTVARRSAR